MKAIRNFKRKQVVNFLSRVNPEKLISDSERKAIKAFKNAAKNSPGYKKILQSKQIDPKAVQTISDFKELVPPASKKDVFANNDITECLCNKKFEDVQIITSSSGFSGYLAFGFDRKKDIEKGRVFYDISMDILFSSHLKKTLLINTLAMGVHIETSYPLIETSVRSDIVLGVLKKISPKFEQTLIVGDPHFLKKVAEEGNEEHIPWDALQVSFTAGQDWFPESWRTYMAKITNINLLKNSDRKIIASMGTTELGLGIFHENMETIQIRQAMEQSPELKKQFYSDGPVAAPHVFVYYPTRHYIEEVQSNGTSHLLFTTLDKKRFVQLIRYDTGDRGKIYSYTALKNLLVKNQLESFLPKFKLPVALVYGRNKHAFTYNGKPYYIEDIKSAIYSNSELARATTGYFRYSKSKLPEMQIQLNLGFDATKALQQKYSDCLVHSVPEETQLKIIPYHEFLHGMELNFEKKFIFI